MLTCFICCSCFASAAIKKKELSNVLPTDSLIVTFINAPCGKINIGGKNRSQYDIITANMGIVWTDNKQYIEVINKRNGNKYKISASSYKEVGKPSINDFIKERYTADKGANGFYDNLKSEAQYLEKYSWDIISETANIPTSLKLNDDCYIVLTSIPGYSQIIADYDDETNEFIISTDMLEKAGVNCKELGKYRFHLDYVHDRVKEPLTDFFKLRIIDPK